jgi:GNAT superfamily N-acetyltransferase
MPPGVDEIVSARGGSMKDDGVRYRQAVTADSRAIASLHADSWRRHYRGAYLDSYLDREVDADRQAEWSYRLTRPAPDRLTMVADLGGAVVGFAYTILDFDPRWGAYLDALHVRHDLKRRGIGAQLMARTARAIARRRPSTGLYLWVLEQNIAAQAFYQTLGGRCIECELSGPFPGGGYAYSYRYAWLDLSRLAKNA